MKYLNIKSLRTMPDGRQCLTYIENGEELDLVGPAIMRMLVPDDVRPVNCSTIRLELVAADQVVDV
jgi:hypothetical protein